MKNNKSFVFVLLLVVSLAIPVHTSYASINDDGSFYVASWNLKNLGPSKANKAVDLNKYVAEITSTAYAPNRYDIVFVQELQGSAGVSSSFQILCNVPAISAIYSCARAPLNDKYAPVGNNPPGLYNRQAGNNEYYGVLYKTNLIGGTITKGNVVDTANSFSTKPIGAGYTKYVARPPMQASFTITDTTSNESHPFTFLNSHITFNNKYGPPTDPGLSKNKKQQKNIQSEIEIIHNYINTSVLSINPTHNVVFLGDMNAGVLKNDPSQGIRSWGDFDFPAFNFPNWNRLIFEPNLSTTPAGSAHDKIILNGAAQSKHHFPNDKGVADTGVGVSDHNLIWIKFDLSPAQMTLDKKHVLSDKSDSVSAKKQKTGSSSSASSNADQHLDSSSFEINNNPLDLYIVKKTDANVGTLFSTVSKYSTSTNTNSEGEFDWTIVWPNPILEYVSNTIGGYNIQEFYVIADNDNNGKISATDEKVYFEVYKKTNPDNPDPIQPVRPPTQRYPVADPPGKVWFPVGEPINIKLPHDQKWFPHTPDVVISHPVNGNSFTADQLNAIKTIFEELVVFTAEIMLVEVGVEAILAPEFLEVEVPADIIADSVLITNKAKTLLGESQVISDALNTEQRTIIAERMFGIVKSNLSYVLKEMLYMGEKFVYDKTSVLPAFLRPDSPTKPEIQIPEGLNDKIKGQLHPRLYIIDYRAGTIPTTLQDVRGSTAYNEIKLYDDITHEEFTWQNPTSGIYTLVLDINGDGNYNTTNHDVANFHGFTVGSCLSGTLPTQTYDLNDSNNSCETSNSLASSSPTGMAVVFNATIPDDHDVVIHTNGTIGFSNILVGNNTTLQIMTE